MALLPAHCEGSLRRPAVELALERLERSAHLREHTPRSAEKHGSPLCVPALDVGGRETQQRPGDVLAVVRLPGEQEALPESSSGLADAPLHEIDCAVVEE
jgi:hypothetical protein